MDEPGTSSSLQQRTLWLKSMMLKWSSMVRSSRMACMASTVCEGKRWNNCVLQSGHAVAVFHGGGGGEGLVVVLEGLKRLNLHFSEQPLPTCFILTPHMEPLTSMTNTMFFGSGERFIGAKNWTKWPSDTWKTHLFKSLGPS